MKIDYFRCLDVAALLFQLWGGIMMYLNSPNNTASIGPLFDDYEQEEQPIENNKNKSLKRGFLLLVVGIVIALISAIFK